MDVKSRAIIRRLGIILVDLLCQRQLHAENIPFFLRDGPRDGIDTARRLRGPRDVAAQNGANERQGQDSKQPNTEHYNLHREMGSESSKAVEA